MKPLLKIGYMVLAGVLYFAASLVSADQPNILMIIVDDLKPLTGAYGDPHAITPVMDALQANGMADNTLVVLWGDHGWHLGDHGMWCKHTNYEQATRAPLIIMDPRQGRVGTRVLKATEFLDIAPTLVDLAGLSPFDDFQGHSLKNLMKNPQSRFKSFAISQFARSHGGPNRLMGYAFRNQRYRLILWIEMDYKNGDRNGNVVATELYDYATDPLETVNLAKSPEHQELVNRLLNQASAFAGEHMEISWNL